MNALGLITALSTSGVTDDMVSDVPLPLWLEMILSPWILFLIISPLIGSLIMWKFIFSNCGDEVEKKDRQIAIRKTWITVTLSNILSSVGLMILEFMMRIVMTENQIHFSGLTIWDSPATVIVYMIPIIISFLIIFFQVRRRGTYLVSDRMPVKIASWVMAILYSPWYIIIPMSAIKNLTEVIS